MQGFMLFIGMAVAFIISFSFDDEFCNNPTGLRIFLIILCFLVAIVSLAGHYEGWWIVPE